MDTKTFAIGTLTVTAVILAAALLLVGALGKPQEAMAFGQSAYGGDYYMVSGQYQTGTEVVYIMDSAANRLNTYVYNINTKTVDLVDSIDLLKMSAAAGGAPAAAPGGKKKATY